MWNGFVAIFLKDDRHQKTDPDRIVHSMTDFSSGDASNVDSVLRHSERGPDFALIEWQRELLAKQDSQIATLEHQLATSDQQAQALRQQLDERVQMLSAQTAQVASLEQQVARSQRAAAGLSQRFEQALQIHEKMRQSSSWRMTAPYRALRDLTRPPARALKRPDLLYRAVTAPLLLPAYLAYKGDWHGFSKAWRPRSGFVVSMIEVQNVIRERLLERGSMYRRIASLGFSLAFRIHERGSVPRAARSFLRILRRDGPSGVRQWLDAVAPGMARLAPQGALDSGTAAPLVSDVARRILVAGHRIPRPDVSAGERATVGILKDLCALGFDVAFVANDMAPSPVYAAELQQVGVEVVTTESGHETSRQYVERHGSKFGAFYFIRVDVAETLLQAARHAAPQARIVFHAPELYFLREMRAAELRQDEAAHQRAMDTRDRTLLMMRQSDHVVVASTAEVPMLRPELPNTPISVFPVLDAPVIHSPRGFDDRRHVFFLGKFSHPPNVDAVQWFATVVWPIVQARLPDVEFHIVGADAPQSVVDLGDLPGIKFIGYAANLDPVFETIRVGVAPLLYGAGIKEEVAVTLGAGIPCVCTNIAAEGMGIEDGVHALVADDPHSFAEAAVSLHSDASLWKHLSENGQALVEDRFGDAANRASLLEVLNAARVLPLELYCEHSSRIAPAALPAARDGASIDVSIIVPVYNKWHLTRACLNSVIETSRGCGVRYELILADDGSSDDTGRAGEIFPGLRVARTPSNLGFLRNCNNAARHARGRHLLLLNNDTVVLPGWLKALYRNIESDPTIAIVGSKMLYPDGHIQEAGGGLLANGDGVSVGRWIIEAGRTLPVLRDHAAFNIERETDYVSGASILVRKSFWDSVGGFDERYQPAYCEDADLAMTARAHGMRVVYQPASEIVHFEHQSYAEQADANHTHLMAKNKQLLFEKWKETLRCNHLPPGR